MNESSLIADEFSDEVECVDCGCDLIRNPDMSEQRCDTDQAHHTKDCGEDCPVICEICKEHHFDDTPVTLFCIGADHWPGISKVTEEAGEVLQIAGKLMGSMGVIHHWDGTNLKDRIEEELADLYAAIQFVVEHCHLDEDRFLNRAAEKRQVFNRWHADQTAKMLK
jgi:NTP pyrophosphatase (non-canonical NTP hydrolase)